MILSDGISAQLTTAAHRHRCALIDWLRKGFALLHFTDPALINNITLGDVPPAVMPNVNELDSNDILSRDILPPEGTDLDLGEHRG
jgi:hypothetical protein